MTRERLMILGQIIVSGVREKCGEAEMDEKATPGRWRYRTGQGFIRKETYGDIHLPTRFLLCHMIDAM